MDFGLTLIGKEADGSRATLSKDAVLSYIGDNGGTVTWDGESAAYCQLGDGGVVNLKASELYTEDPLLGLSVDLWEESLTNDAFGLIAGLAQATEADVKDRLSGETVAFSDAGDLLAKTKESYEQFLAFFSGQA